MKTISLFFVAVLVTFVDFQLSPTEILVRNTEAEARPYYGTDRRVARRTARRTSRRVTRRNYYSHLPSGCYWASPYYRCGSVSYQPVVESGVTVYIIVD